MIVLNLDPIDVILQSHGVFKDKHKKDNPGKSVPHRFGAEIFASAIVLMSAMIQSYVEDVFKSAVKKKFLHIKTEDEVDKFWKLVGHWGNPTKDNINRLFLRVGIINLMENFQFDGKDCNEDMKYLGALNTIRNKIAHGKINFEYQIGDDIFKMTQGETWGWRSFVDNFGKKFEAHVEEKLR